MHDIKTWLGLDTIDWEHCDFNRYGNCYKRCLGVLITASMQWIVMVLISRRLNLFIGDVYNRYTCPLQPCRYLTLKLFIQGHPWNCKVSHVADFSDVVRFDLGHLL